MLISKTLTITDDSGFLAIVNADSYKSFVDENWGQDQLMKHFLNQMNTDNLIIWATGLEGTWTVDFSDKQSDEKSFREFSKLISVTDGRLCLTNYEDLTMAAQFKDERIPASHNKDLFVQLNNGIYKVTVRQFSDPSQSKISDSRSLEVVLQKADNANGVRIDKVFWWTK